MPSSKDSSLATAIGVDFGHFESSVFFFVTLDACKRKKNTGFAETHKWGNRHKNG